MDEDSAPAISEFVMITECEKGIHRVMRQTRKCYVCNLRMPDDWDLG